jgi:hypothetical protein
VLDSAGCSLPGIAVCCIPCVTSNSLSCVVRASSRQSVVSAACLHRQSDAATVPAAALLQDQAWFDAHDGKESLPTKISQNAVRPSSCHVPCVYVVREPCLMLCAVLAGPCRRGGCGPFGAMRAVGTPLPSPLPPPRASYRTATATAPHAAVTATWAQVMLREGLGVSISQTIQAPLGFLFAMIRRGPHANAGRATCNARHTTRAARHAAHGHLTCAGL